MNLDYSTPIKTSDLDKRFNISKNTRVHRLVMLGLTPDRLSKEGKFYYLTPEQLELFEHFDRYIRETGSSENYPHLVSPSSAAVKPEEGNNESEHGQLVTASSQALNNSVPPSSDLFSSGVTGEFTESLRTYPVSNPVAQHLVENAQLRATAMIMAENALADQYINNPQLLDPSLRAQIDSFQFSQIDPKGLAASLIAAAQRQMDGAA